ncbi:hypothetical protein V6N13_041576 [Hibiscus sabdariffa]|uniref:Myb-like domain-containing protein n=1 Tax=Hibiscus sabdariffa TaxID=183260 RepID=A0ABR2RBQ4_9ROSI
MEDHHHHLYGMPVELLNGRPTSFQEIPLPQIAPQLFSSCQQDLPPPQQSHRYHFGTMQMVGTQIVADQLMPCGLLQEFHSDHSTANNVVATVTATSTPSASCGFDGEATAFGGDAGTGRWPSQETLTLFEIRSHLDPMFKEANQKGPLWEQVSRIMSEEYGYQRSGETICKEKSEILYQYYKKTREVKAGRHDGKHHRFFGHLETLYGDTSSSVSLQETHLLDNSFPFHGTLNSSSQANHEASHSDQKHCHSFSLSQSSGFETDTPDDNDLITAEAMERKKKKGGITRWKVKIKEFVDSQMMKLMERQEAWIEKLTKTLEQKEKERVSGEEEWRNEEAARIGREHKFWAKERAWIKARDAALMEALQNLTGKQLKGINSLEDPIATEKENQNGSGTRNLTVKADGWQESEVSWLIQLRTCMEMESRFEEEGCSEEILWEEIAAKMASLGFERSALMCKHKWKSIGACLMKTKGGNRKRKNTRCSDYDYRYNENLCSQGREYCDQPGPEAETVRHRAHEGSSPSNSNAGNAENGNRFRFFTAEGENL